MPKQKNPSKIIAGWSEFNDYFKNLKVEGFCEHARLVKEDIVIRPGYLVIEKKVKGGKVICLFPPMNKFPECKAFPEIIKKEANVQCKKCKETFSPF